MDAFRISATSKVIDDLSKFAGSKCFNYLLDLKTLSICRSMRSTLELLLLLHCFLKNMTAECQCDTKYLWLNCNNTFLLKYFALMKDLLEFISNKISKNLVKNIYSDWKNDYQLHLLHLLKITFCKFYNESISQHYLSLDEFDENILVELRTVIDQLIKAIELLISRHGWHYRKEMQQYNRPSRAGPPVHLPIRHQFFNFYEDYAAEGKFPHIFWQETSLREKIKFYGSLEEIFSKGNEVTCCICMTHEEEYKDNFAIFLDCNHIVCASCAELLLIDDRQTR